MIRLVLMSALFGLSLQACDPKVCVLPNCRCYNDQASPGGLETSDIPQIVMVSFEGTITSASAAGYRAIFTDVNNPNGCPGRGTFFIQDEGTDYRSVKGLADEGHEIGIQSVDGKSPETSTGWIDALKKVRTGMESVAVDTKNVLGVRAPQLAPGGSEELIGIGSNNMLYDSSCSNVGYSDPGKFIWPYTFDYLPTATCDNGKAPDKPFPGKWEVPIADLHDLSGDNLPCTVPSACRNITTKRNAFDLFFTPFEEHNNGKRTPFLMIIDPTWASKQDLMDGTVEFLQYIRAAYEDVWVLPIIKALEWIQDPTPIANLTDFTPWDCTQTETHTLFFETG